MNESWDELERELRSIRPRPVRGELHRAVGRRLAATRRIKFAVIACATLAAAVLVVVAPHWIIRPERDQHDAPQVSRDSVKSNDTDSQFDPRGDDAQMPNLWLYRTATQGSIDDLERLLASHAKELLPPVPDIPLWHGNQNLEDL